MTYKSTIGGKPTGNKAAPRRLKKAFKKAIINSIGDGEVWNTKEVRIISVRVGERINRKKPIIGTGMPVIGNKQVSCYTLG